MDLEELKRVWNEFGAKDPLWAVLTEPSKKDHGWDPEEFFRLGEEEIQAVLSHIAGLGIEISRKRALDFGCGVGRLTRALAGRFEEATGVDISPSMVDAARRLNKDFPNCRFLLNERDDLAVFPDRSFDFIYSNITLQHMDPRYAVRYINEFLRLLAPGGMLAFQLPSRPISLPLRLVYGFSGRAWYRYQARRARPGLIMEVHAVPKRRIVELLRRAGTLPVSIIRDFYAGEKWLSLKYYVFKPKWSFKILRAGGPGPFPKNEISRLEVELENARPEQALADPAENDVRLGGKLYPAAAGTGGAPLKEFRADLPFPVPAGGRAKADMALDLTGVKEGRYLLALDFVHEHRYWFSQLGFQPLIKKIRVS